MKLHIIFQIHLLSTGTEVTIHGAQSTHISAEIRPSIKDVGMTEGFCGDLDGNRWNDLKHRNNEAIIAGCPMDYVYNETIKQFGISWK